MPVDLALKADPNRYAPFRGIVREPGGVWRVEGYQTYRISDAGLIALSEAGVKQALLAAIPVAGRTVLDLGANAGFFSFWAARRRASGVIALEMDAAYVAAMRQVRDRFFSAGPSSGIAVCQESAADWTEPADVVYALGLVHWLYAATADFGAVEAIVTHLARLTREVCAVEWVDPEDPLIQGHGHLDLRPEVVRAPYTREAFEAAMRVRFARVTLLGSIRPTRRLYAGYAQRDQ